MTLEGLFHYLKIPFDKLGQDRRFREIITFKAKSKVPKEECNTFVS